MKKQEKDVSLSLDDLPKITGIPDSSARSNAPEEQFFKSIYVPGKRRKNADGVNEEPGKFQIFQTENNLDDVNMIIVHIKEVLSKVTKTDKGEITECFCFMDNRKKPYKGTSGRDCNDNHALRKNGDEYCKTCLNNVIMAGIWCDPQGEPILREGKPVFCFVKAKKILNIISLGKYLKEFYNLDLSPMIKPVTDDSIKHEKKELHPKRFVTNIKMGTMPTDYGDKPVMTYSRGVELPLDKVVSIVKLAQKTEEKFINKFDVSKRLGESLVESNQKNGFISFDENTGDSDQQPDSSFDLDSVEI
jgi:hypothetical protein